MATSFHPQIARGGISNVPPALFQFVQLKTTTHQRGQVTDPSKGRCWQFHTKLAIVPRLGCVAFSPHWGCCCKVSRLNGGGIGPVSIMVAVGVEGSLAIPGAHDDKVGRTPRGVRGLTVLNFPSCSQCSMAADRTTASKQCGTGSTANWQHPSWRTGELEREARCSGKFSFCCFFLLCNGARARGGGQWYMCRIHARPFFHHSETIVPYCIT